MPGGDSPAPATMGLRERKKIKTREAIRREAFRLIDENGFANTTVEQIADAAEVSPSTFLRYFPSKESVLLADDLDPVLLDALEHAPADLSPSRRSARPSGSPSRRCRNTNGNSSGLDSD